MKRDTDWAFARYEGVRAALPVAKTARTSVYVDHLGDVADLFDVFLLDAFGVLNVGETVIPGAVERISVLQDAGKTVLVVTNSASHPADVALAKYRRLGFDFALNDVVSSRDALAVALRAQPPRQWGVMAIDGSELGQLPMTCHRLDETFESFNRAEGFILLGAGQWSVAQQDFLVAALRANPRPVLVGNPDIVAPREGALSLEPGNFAHDVQARTGLAPVFYGKPFANVYDLALSRISPDIPKSRIVMVGDTLHTDVLGGAAAGLKTLLVLNHGLFAGREIGPFIEQSGLVPDYIAEDT